MRTCVIEFGKVLIKRHFVSRFNERYPNFTYGNGRKVASFEDFSEGALLMNNFDNSMRSIVYYTSTALWGTNNTWAHRAEKEILQQMKLEYSGVYCEGKRERSTMGGCIKAILVDTKQNCVVEVIRTRCKNMYGEVLLKREPKKVKDASGALTHRMAGGKNPQVAIVKATKQSHGFTGFVNIFSNHPSATEEKQATLVSTPFPATPPPVQREQTGGPPRALEAWFEAKMKSGTITTKKDLLKLMVQEEAANSVRSPFVYVLIIILMNILIQ